jgi:hypothetical protein
MYISERLLQLETSSSSISSTITITTTTTSFRSTKSASAGSNGPSSPGTPIMDSAMVPNSDINLIPPQSDTLFDTDVEPHEKQGLFQGSLRTSTLSIDLQPSNSTAQTVPTSAQQKGGLQHSNPWTHGVTIFRPLLVIPKPPGRLYGDRTLSASKQAWPTLLHNGVEC